MGGPMRILGRNDVTCFGQYNFAHNKRRKKRLTNERPGKWSCDLCWPMRGLEINCIVMGQHTQKTQTSRLLGWISLEANSVKSRACICGCLLMTESAPLGRFSHKVSMYGCLSVCAIRWSFFLGLSLALRSHDQFQASHWSSLPPSLGNLETWKLGNSHPPLK